MGPIFVALKVTLTVQLAAGLSCFRQLLVWLKVAKLEWPRAMLLSVIAVLPVLVTVTGSGVLLVPTFWLPKLRAGGESSTKFPPRRVRSPADSTMRCR